MNLSKLHCQVMQIVTLHYFFLINNLIETHLKGVNWISYFFCSFTLIFGVCFILRRLFLRELLNDLHGKDVK